MPSAFAKNLSTFNLAEFMNLHFKLSCWVLIICGLGLRVLLCWVNPPANAFDNHFDPIFWIMNHGTIAPKDALWQSYHPPVFYVISAIIGKLAVNQGVPLPLIPKILQFIPCFYAVMTLVVIYLILQKLPFSDFAKWCALGTICFLPRHIYASAMHSNDTIAALAVALSLYLLLVIRERNFSYPWVIATGVAVVVTIFTKYTAFVILPLTFVAYLSAFWQLPQIAKRKLLPVGFILIVVPLLFLGSYCFSNMKNYGNPLPWNAAMLDPAKTQPKAEDGINFLNFKPWETIRTPILAPTNIGSFWTLIHSRMWFDMEPKFLPYVDHVNGWWKCYYQWLRGERSWPTLRQFNPNSKRMGSLLITMGLVPLLMAITGFVLLMKKIVAFLKAQKQATLAELLLFPLLFVTNAGGVIALALRAPVFSAMKAQYFLNSLPSFAVFIGFGANFCEPYRFVKWLIIMLYCSLFGLVTLHIFQLAASFSFVMG